MKKEELEKYRHIKPRESLYIWAYTKGSLAPKPLPLTNKASWFVLKLHKNEKRDDGSNYCDHPLDACRIALNFGIRDDATLAGILLHDTVENGKTTKEKIRKGYSDEVAKIVDDQSKKPGETQKEYFKRIAKNIKSVIGKGADRLSNVGSMIGTFKIDRMERYIKETEKYVLPMIEEARHSSLEYCDTLVALRDSIERIIIIAKKYVRSENERIKLEEIVIKKINPAPITKRSSGNFIPLADVVPKVEPSS